jgi:putative membrane protein insertion efficiency factor
MSPLQQPLKRPETYLAILSIAILFAVVDSYRSPANQVTGYLYVTGVHLYQVVGRPLLKRRIRCRYQPTCSEYSIAAVRQYGLRRGFLLTVKRINSCTTKVPLGTPDPVLRAPDHGVTEGR